MRWSVLAAIMVSAFALLAGCVTSPGGRAREAGQDDEPQDEGDARLGLPGGDAEDAAECPDPHWHATFAVYVHGDDGAPRRVDFAAPKTPGGQPYFDYDSFGRGGAPNFSPTLHMHQTGEESGSSALGPAQWHMEKRGKCISVEAALAAVEVHASEDHLDLSGAHAQVAGQAGRFEPGPGGSLRFWVEQESACGEWQWQEAEWDSIRGRQLEDGEALLVAVGTFGDDEVATMQASVPAPISRMTGDCEA